MYRFRMALLAVLVLAPVAVARPDKGDDVDRLARRLERDAHDLHDEVLAHFSKSPLSRDMNKHAQQIERLAAKIHKLAHDKARPRAIRELVNEIDEEIRHLDRHVRELGREKELNRKAYDHLRDEITDINRTLYRLRRELP